jgi:hypothetical protein
MHWVLSLIDSITLEIKVKVAINRCFGGFSISNAAFEKLLERKGVEYQKVPSKYKIRGDEYDYYQAGIQPSDDTYISDYEYYDNRSDADLIAVIEEMGESANGWAAEIALVEIPEDVEWHIHEYDGLEHVAENHRTWD